QLIIYPRYRLEHVEGFNQRWIWHNHTTHASRGNDQNIILIEKEDFFWLNIEDDWGINFSGTQQFQKEGPRNGV
ncbi:hypothetical protein ACJX0J_030525, partial [Zea mays]